MISGLFAKTRAIACARVLTWIIARRRLSRYHRGVRVGERCRRTSPVFTYCTSLGRNGRDRPTMVEKWNIVPHVFLSYGTGYFQSIRVYALPWKIRSWGIDSRMREMIFLQEFSFSFRGICPRLGSLVALFVSLWSYSITSMIHQRYGPSSVPRDNE